MKEPETLPDYLRRDLEIVFVGINPGLYSAQIGHYFAGRGNLFWTALFESGLVQVRLCPQDDHRILEHGMGLTDVAKRPTRGINDLARDELSSGAPALRAKIDQYEPRIVCFNGLAGYRAFFGRDTKPGRQEVLFGASRVFVVPSTSRRNAYYRPPEVIRYFAELRSMVEEKGWNEGLE